jgi:hypothetical protein
MSKSISAISKVVTQDALEVVSQKLTHNVWARNARSSPNAENLKDGAVQRMSVSPSQNALHIKANPNKIGFYKREELTERASQGAFTATNVWDDPNIYRNKIARVYQP